jgi:hypothetical protein
VIGNAGANDSSTHDNDIRSLHIAPIGNGPTFLTNQSDHPTRATQHSSAGDDWAILQS